MSILRCLCILLLVIASATGTQAAAQAPAVQPAAPSPSASRQLPGTWAGISYLDEDRIGEHLAQLPDDKAREVLLHKAAAFLSVVIAIEFRHDGTLESELEVADEQGNPLIETTTGRWRIAERKEDRLIVELEERLADGKERKSRRLIQFYEDGDHLAILMDADPALAPFNPLFILERVPAGEIAQAPGTEQAAPPRINR